MPFTRLEIAVMSLVEGRLQVLLARRAQAPYSGKWALPGGVLRIDLDASLEDAARRVMRERLGTELPYLRQLRAVGGPTRDPRAPWAISIVFRGLVPISEIQATPGKRIEALRWFAVDELPGKSEFAFDHAVLILDAVHETRKAIEVLQLPTEFLPPEFTLGELQATCEQLLGRRLDKSSFRRRLRDAALLEPMDGKMRTGPFRPAQLYRPAVSTS